MKNARAYILLDIVDGKEAEATRKLSSMPGIVIVDRLEGTPNVLIMVEAARRQQLAELTNSALAAVGPLTQEIRLMPVQANGRHTIARKGATRTSN